MTAALALYPLISICLYKSKKGWHLIKNKKKRIFTPLSIISVCSDTNRLFLALRLISVLSERLLIEPSTHFQLNCLQLTSFIILPLICSVSAPSVHTHTHTLLSSLVVHLSLWLCFINAAGEAELLSRSLTYSLTRLAHMQGQGDIQLQIYTLLCLHTSSSACTQPMVRRSHTPTNDWHTCTR